MQPKCASLAFYVSGPRATDAVIAHQRRQARRLRVPGDTRLARLLIFGAINWSGQWYRRGARLSLDEIAAGTARLFLHSGVARMERKRNAGAAAR
jgi:hypothetical protein